MSELKIFSVKVAIVGFGVILGAVTLPLVTLLGQALVIYVARLLGML